ncbi:hypothetical protein [Streptococcus thoraltensis]|uniref:hypothetical protein n=1 Tax=Streptococcus thoraltensis TaxID=55085 RepID=UPI000370B5C7|nr:hypothetical protein [Streptococcus thoraltensis]
MSNKRIFGDPLRDMDKNSKFSLDVPKDIVASLTFDSLNIQNLMDPYDFIESERIQYNLTKDDVYLMKPTVEYSKGWFYSVSYVAVHEVAAGANVVAGLTTVVGAATLVAVALGVLASDPDKSEEFFKKVDNEFLSKISKKALKVGGVSYLKDIIEQFVQTVKEYNSLGEINE